MEELVLQYSCLSILYKYFDKKIEISKECPWLNQYYYETLNSYLNLYLLKKVVLLSNHENLLTNHDNHFNHVNLLTQEHCILVMLFLISTFF